MFKFTTILASIIIGSIGIIKAQSSEVNLKEVNDNRLQLNRNGMKILGGWAAGNIAAGAVGMTQSSGNTRYFHQMNLAWNGVNLAIAGLGYIGSKKDPSSFDLKQTIREYHSFENILLFNAGLDVGYMATGAFLWERGLRKDSERLKGYGQSLILQGAFLFSFDLVMFLASKNQSSKLLDTLDGLSLQPTGLSYHREF
ncbi:DUF6992 family protein [Rhodohalobacter sp. 8-1]|uniref:DUF6992 family protein n=1 Tax=Rhodohalobacter sp. 8-1 TaxID=3131972 RepID=UPI0030EC6C21